MALFFGEEAQHDLGNQIRLGLTLGLVQRFADEEAEQLGVLFELFDLLSDRLIIDDLTSHSGDVLVIHDFTQTEFFRENRDIEHRHPSRENRQTYDVFFFSCD